MVAEGRSLFPPRDHRLRNSPLVHRGASFFNECQDPPLDFASRAAPWRIPTRRGYRSSPLYGRLGGR